MKKFLSAMFALLFVCGVSGASEEVKTKAESIIPELKKLIETPEIIKAIKEQNAKNASLTQAEIDALDKKWMAHDASVITPVINSPSSGLLKKILLDSKGLYTEIFIMDNKGLNVAQSGPTSDYWQGDEDKWQKTFLMGASGVHISKIEYDDSSKQFQFQLSFSIVDGDAVIGAVTFGISWDKLKTR